MRRIVEYMLSLETDQIVWADIDWEPLSVYKKKGDIFISFLASDGPKVSHKLKLLWGGDSIDDGWTFLGTVVIKSDVLHLFLLDEEYY